jgi:gamma-glutamylcyclotransferase (GGCT)/AIG2-like uncharacterized protein YtfP
MSTDAKIEKPPMQEQIQFPTTTTPTIEYRTPVVEILPLNEAETDWDKTYSKFAFYGSLRKGCYNHAIIQNGCKIVEQNVRLPKFSMVGTGYGYPMAFFTGDESDSIVVELVEVENERLQEQLQWMEIGAGYYVQEILVDGVKYWLYLHDAEPIKADMLASITRRSTKDVPGNDWLEYQKVQAKKQGRYISEEGPF